MCFGVRVSVMFHLMIVHYTFSSVGIAEWPPYGKCPLGYKLYTQIVGIPMGTNCAPLVVDLFNLL